MNIIFNSQELSAHFYLTLSWQRGECVYLTYRVDRHFMSGAGFFFFLNRLQIHLFYTFECRYEFSLKKSISAINVFYTRRNTLSSFHRSVYTRGVWNYNNNNKSVCVCTLSPAPRKSLLFYPNHHSWKTYIYTNTYTVHRQRYIMYCILQPYSDRGEKKLHFYNKSQVIIGFVNFCAQWQKVKFNSYTNHILFARPLIIYI